MYTHTSGMPQLFITAGVCVCVHTHTPAVYSLESTLKSVHSCVYTHSSVYTQPYPALDLPGYSVPAEYQTGIKLEGLHNSRGELYIKK